ncbi:MAG: hypothetical protein F4Y31_05385 [Gammaproteobacteria bacterium]|nr:hypothetical protein [Gammaproteobacteria bacterium]MYF66233.1 hypothetical protein [Gammaproteobacteria bacterium]MYK38240.1 hypothetical protein [Gammaproteobacteria bacterium]
MLELLPQYLATAATSLTALVAYLMLRHQRIQEKNRISLLKHQSEVAHLQKLIASLAKVIALASDEWSEERSQAINKAIKEMQFHVTALQSLSNVVAADVDQWAVGKDKDGKSISAIIYYDLGMQQVIVGDAHKQFMQSKMDALKRIQDKLFSSMTRS